MNKKVFTGPCPKSLNQETCIVRVYSSDNASSALRQLSEEDCQGIALFFNAEDRQTTAFFNINCLQVLGVLQKIFGANDKTPLPPIASVHSVGNIFSQVLRQNIGTEEAPQWVSVTLDEALDILWKNADEASLHLIDEGQIAA
jgi:hypothetical protein